MDRRDIAKSHLDDAGRLQDLKRYVRFQAKVSVIDILLSNDTLEARQRIRAKRRVKSSSWSVAMTLMRWAEMPTSSRGRHG
jgi:hypothetical protein